jgi:hypothetical protein
LELLTLSFLTLPKEITQVLTNKPFVGMVKTYKVLTKWHQRWLKAEKEDGTRLLPSATCVQCAKEEAGPVMP